MSSNSKVKCYPRSALDTAFIAAQNDHFRKSLSCGGQEASRPSPQVIGRVFFSSAVSLALPPLQADALEAIANFDDFDAENDRLGDRSSGTVTVHEKKLIWNIYLCDFSYRFESSNPADLAVTRRVLTVMFSNEF